ncbi:efflux RND transporter periplasmic adaptor subunit [Psychrobium sp. 1_MG-2023]|uniref:efflux RND transporter periplasmic adaptor subunit n=1 Tax=Psychrobium sp. 1_MG-2023 TaxID=3062624 RepID=UPI002735DBA7|nr:efflux RND transporter periplasmic adaptor subunit [Psychrobium sp. 1_MG-2023]MDP2560054.1 efflux RND transporter periplasmic adaptor subunit [Psychrobium sp. 1_MG-2023]
MPSRTKRILRVLIPVLILLFFVIVAGAISSMKQQPEKKEQEVKAPLIDTYTVELKDQPLSLNSYGVLRPKHQTQIIAEVSGRIISVSERFASGGIAKKGTVLAQIDPSDYQAALIEAQANLVRAQAALQEEIARGKVAEVEWKQEKSILPPELGLRKPQLAREQANVRSAEALLARAERNLERTKVVAPYDALINQRQIDLGQFITTGAGLGSISSINHGEIRLPVSNEDYAFLVQNSETQTITLHREERGKIIEWSAKLIRDEGVIDEDSRMVHLVAEVENPYQQQPKLKFGTFLKAQMQSQVLKNIAVIPSYLYRDGKVSIIDSDNILRERPVTLYKRDKNNVYISAGLNQGDLIAVTKIEHLYDGMPVRLSTDAAIEEVDNEEQLAQTGAQ